MRIVDYPSLQQAILDFSHRADLSAYVDYFIQLGETRIYRDILDQNMGAGIRLMETALSGTIDATAGTVAVPADYLALKTMRIQDGNGCVSTLVYKDPEWIYAQYPDRTPQCIPSYVARDLGVFIFGPSPDSAYNVSGTYWNQATALTTDNTTSWMTTGCPDVIFNACMAELQPFLLDAARSASWEAAYLKRLNTLISQDLADRWSNATMQIQPG